MLRYFSHDPMTLETYGVSSDGVREWESFWELDTFAAHASSFLNNCSASTMDSSTTSWPFLFFLLFSILFMLAIGSFICACSKRKR